MKETRCSNCAMCAKWQVFRRWRTWRTLRKRHGAFLAKWLEQHRRQVHCASTMLAQKLQPTPQQTQEAPCAPVPAQEPPKRPGHRWQKGQSGNPAGKARYTLPSGQTIREAARAVTPQALTFLVEVMENKKAPLQVRVSAAVALLRTGHADRTPETLTDDERPKVLIVQKYLPLQPVPGVLQSPVRQDVALPSMLMQRLLYDPHADASEETP
jgi:hypothetical protein